MRDQSPDRDAYPALGALRRRPAAGAALFFVLGALLVGTAAAWLGRDSAEPAPLTLAQVDDRLNTLLLTATPPPADSTVAYRIILPSLVIIRTEAPDSDGEDGFGIGTGVIINQDGAILTSLHVVDDATTINVTFADGTQTTATVAAAQPENDIAVLQPARPPGEFMPAVLAGAGGLRVGDVVFAVGNPLGLAGSLSAGVVSGLGRSFQPEDSPIRLEEMIQFDAAVNPGNSGGPLLDRNGHVVGIVTGLVNPTAADVFIGIGFAVPIGTAVAAVGGGPSR